MGDGLNVEGAALIARDARLHLALAAAQLGVGGKPRDAERAALEPACLNGCVDRRAVGIEHDSELRATQPDAHVGPELGVARLYRAVDPLEAIFGTEVELAVEPTAIERHRAEEPALDDVERAVGSRAADVQPRDLNARGAARRQQDRTFAVECAQQRLALRGEGIAARIGSQLRGHVAQAHRRVGRCEPQVERGSADIPVEFEAYGTVAALLPRSFEAERPVTASETVAAQGQVGRGQHQVTEIKHAVRPALQPGGDARQAAGERAEEGVVQPHDLRRAGADNARAAPAGTGHHPQTRLHIDDAQTGDQVATQTAGQADFVIAGAQVEHQADLSRQPVGGEAQIVAGDERRRDAQRPVHGQVAEDAARDIADPGHARGGEAHRYRHGRGRQPPAARCARNLEPRLVEGEAIGSQPVIVARGRERAVEDHPRLDIATVHVGEQRLWLEQSRAHPHRAVGRTCQIDHAFRFDRDGARADRQITVELAIIERSRPGDRDRGRSQPLDLALRQRAERKPPAERIGAAGVPQLQVDDADAIRLRQRDTGPAFPVALSVDAQLQRLGDAGQPRQHAIGPAPRLHVDVEAAFGFGDVEFRAQHVAALDQCDQIDHRTTRSDIGAARDSAGARDAGDGGTDIDAIDAQRPDADIEAGQDRPRAPGRLQCGQAAERRARDVEFFDRQPVVQPGEGPPVERRFRRAEELTLCVGERHIDQPCFGKDRSFDASDAVAQAVGGLHRGDAIDDPAVTDARIEHHQRGGEQSEQQRETARHAARPGIGAAHLNLGYRRRIDVVQNACPSET